MTWFSWAILSAFFAALTAILAKIGVSGLNANLALAIRTTVIVAFTWALAGWTTVPGDWKGLTPRTWFFLGASGLATGLSWLCYFRALQLGDVSKVAPVDKLSLALTLLLAFLFLGERLRPQEIAGASLIVLGVLTLIVKF